MLPQLLLWRGQYTYGLLTWATFGTVVLSAHCTYGMVLPYKSTWVALRATLDSMICLEALNINALLCARSIRMVPEVNTFNQVLRPTV